MTIPSTDAATLRLDKWLWFARFARTRTLAAKLCMAGLVSIADVVVTKPNHAVRIGDVLTVRQGRMLRRVAVRGLGTRRGPPAEARLLYAEPEPPTPARSVEPVGWTSLFDDAEAP